MRKQTGLVWLLLVLLLLVIAVLISGGPRVAPRVEAQSDAVVVYPTSLGISEPSGFGVFTFTLDSQPTAIVSITLSAPNGQCTVSPASVDLDDTNWDTGAPATVTAVNDDIADGTQTCVVETGPASSEDTNYNEEDPADVVVNVGDDDEAGFTVDPASLIISEPADSDVFTFTLTSEPTATVSIPLSAPSGQCTVSPGSLTLNDTNWDIGAPATVTAFNDDIADGTQTCVVVTGPTSSDDANYDEKNPGDVTVDVEDDDQAGITVAPTSLSISEPDGSDTFTITLTSEPTATVSIPLSAPSGQCTVSPGSLTLNDTNWDTGAPATVTAFNDDVIDGTQTCVVETGPTSSDDANYDEKDPGDVTVDVEDDDQAGITVAPTSLSISEPDGSDTFTITLTSEPTAIVSIPLSPSNNQCTVSPGSLTLDDTNWDTGAPATVTAFNDDIIDGIQTCVVETDRAESDDRDYNRLHSDDVTVDVGDDDEAGFIVAPASLTISEPSGSDTFTIALTSEPMATVSIPLSAPSSQCTVSTGSLTLNDTNWDTGAPVTVTAFNDDIADGTQTCIVQTGPTTSGDANYDGKNPGDVTVSVEDDDQAGFTVAPASLTISEPDGFDVFIFTLTSEPTATVSIPLSAPSGQCTVLPDFLTLNDTNWDTGAPATVTAFNDDIADGTQTCLVQTGPTSSDDANYDEKNPDDVTVDVGDDDGAGFTVTPTSLSIREPSGSDIFTLTLTSEPTASVSIPFSAPDGQCSVSPASVDLDADNWDSGAMATVSAIDDDIDDGTQTCLVQTGPTSSDDANYDEKNPDDVTVDVGDDDGAGFTVDPTNLSISEPSGSDVFTFALTSEPTASVSIPLSAANDQCTVSPASVTLDADTWDTGVSATVSAVDDDIDDGTQICVVETGPTSSDDSNYDDRNPVDVTVTVSDDDQAGFTVAPASLTMGEPEGSGTFTIILTSEPTAVVSIPLPPSNGQCTVSPTSVTLDADTWDTGVWATVSAVDDDIADGTQICVVETGPTTSGDFNYDNRNPGDVSVTVGDDDEAGIIIAPTSLTIGEPDGSDTFTIRLTSEPTGSVLVPLATSNNQCSISRSYLWLTPSNWAVGVTTIVRAVDDNIDDGTQTCIVDTGETESEDGNYNGIDPANVLVTVSDDDDVDITVAPTSLTINEPDGSGTFIVSLTTEPAAMVSIPLSTSNNQCTVSPASLTLHPWATSATATVTAVDDDIDDGTRTCVVYTGEAQSDDGGYDGRNPADVTVTVGDDDEAGTDVAPTILSVSEPFGYSTFTVFLTSEPTAVVSIPLSPSNSQCTVSPASLTLSPANWDTGATAIVSAVDDDIADGTQTCQVETGRAQSDDDNYNRRNPADVTVYVGDDDVPGITVAPSNLTIGEPDDSDTFVVSLTSEPTSLVSIPLSPSNSQCTVSPASLTLDADNWATGATATVTAVDDDIADGSQICRIRTGTTTSGDLNYDDQNPNDVTATVTDDDEAGTSVAPTSLSISEPDGSDIFTLRLTSEPTDIVFIQLSAPSGQCTVSPGSLTLNAANWDSGATATVTAVDDDIDDGTQTCVVYTGAAQSDDDNYDGRNPADVTVTVVDDDRADITVVPTTLVVSEPDDSETFVVSLGSQPASTVSIPVSASNSQCTVSPASLTLNAANWDSGAPATVTAVDDDIADGAQICQVVTEAATSADPSYDGRNPADVTVIVGDDDAPNIVVAPISLTVCEPDDSDIFVVSLSSRPAAQVTIPLSATNGQCGVSPGLLTLGTDNWATGATATVSAIDDDDDDDEQICTVETLPANSNDPLYNGLDAANVIVIVEDDEILTYLPVVAYKWPPYPGVPTLEPISNPDNDGIYAVHWSAAPHAEIYILEEDTDNTFPDPSVIYTGPSTNYVVSDRGASRLYYRVKSRNAWGDSEWSGVRRVDVLWEAEPNGEPLTEANGPLVSGLTYYGTFVSTADLEDYFYIKLSSPHYVEIWLTNIAYGQDYDLVLRNENLVYLGYSGELGNANEHIRTKLLPAGKYYIQVFRASEGGSTQPYHLKVVYE